MFKSARSIPRVSLIAIVLACAVSAQEPAQTHSGTPETQVSGGSKRQGINISSTDIPLVLSAVRNLDDDNWLDDLELEVENRSTRPIFYVEILIKFPDAPRTASPNGRPGGLVTHAEYGRKEFASNPGELATDDDVPIKPGDKAVLKVEPLYSQGVKAFLKDHDLSESLIKRLYFRIEEVRFGDGSGFRIGSVPFNWQGTPR